MASARSSPVQPNLGASCRLEEFEQTVHQLLLLNIEDRLCLAVCTTAPGLLLAFEDLQSITAPDRVDCTCSLNYSSTTERRA